MKIELLAPGRIREPFYRQGVEHYLKRLRPYATVELVEGPKERSGAEPHLEAAYQALRGRHMQADRRVVMDERGRQMTSSQLAGWLGEAAREGMHRLSFLLGGPHGLAERAREEADVLLSLSSMTLPNQMARLLLVEQLYRAFTIQRGEPYHK